MTGTESMAIEIYECDSPSWHERVLDSSVDYMLEPFYRIKKNIATRNTWEIGGQLGDFLDGVHQTGSKISMDFWIDKYGNGYFGHFFKNGDLLVAPCKISILRPLLLAAKDTIKGLSKIRFWLEDCEIYHSNTLRTLIKKGNISIGHYKDGNQVYSERIFDAEKHIVK